MSLVWESRPDLLSQSTSTSSEDWYAPPLLGWRSPQGQVVPHYAQPRKSYTLAGLLAPTRHLLSRRWKVHNLATLTFVLGIFRRPLTLCLMALRLLCVAELKFLLPLPAASCRLGGLTTLSTWYCLHLVGAKWCSQCRFPR